MPTSLDNLVEKAVARGRSSERLALAEKIDEWSKRGMVVITLLQLMDWLSNRKDEEATDNANT